ncbi:MAG: CDP-glucose 4,6-dehydratase [Hyphomicrobiaceae bacterium]
MAIGQGAVEVVVSAAEARFWRGKRVLVSGHTGFKGAWLTLWLRQRGALVTGIALAPETTPALFDQLQLTDDIDHRLLDIRDGARLREVIVACRPDIVFHLAAQALVRRGYREPVDTWATNVMGTVHILEALRTLEHRCAAVLVTTDKVYENREWEFGYRETDQLGGHDPYSASKAACEIAVSSWRRSFLGADHPVRIASARAGNVIGGGDWSADRIVPDLMRALSDGKPLSVRNPAATRPWQHVLEPLDGYMRLAERLYEGAAGSAIEDAFNFGPEPEAERSVRDLVTAAMAHWPGASWIDASDPDAPHEAGRLALDIDRSRVRLGWRPRWNFERTIAETVTWYRDCLRADNAAIRARTVQCIAAYEAAIAGDE